MLSQKTKWKVKFTKKERCHVQNINQVSDLRRFKNIIWENSALCHMQEQSAIYFSSISIAWNLKLKSPILQSVMGQIENRQKQTKTNKGKTPTWF